METGKDAPDLSWRKGGRSIYWDCLLLADFCLSALADIARSGASIGYVSGSIQW